jgi:hypothetical protein
LQKTPRRSPPTACASLDQATRASRSPTPRRRATTPDDALWNASPPIVAGLGSRAPPPPSRSRQEAAQPPHSPAKRQAPRPAPPNLPARFSFFPIASSSPRPLPSPDLVQRDVHAQRNAEEERIESSSLGCGGGGPRPNPRSRRRWCGDGVGSPVRSWWPLNTAVPFPRSSRCRATATAPFSRTWWRVCSAFLH